MNILVNNKPYELVSDASLSYLLTQLGLADAKGIAVAVNNQIVHKHSWDSCTLIENNKITIIRATQGG